MRAKEPSRQVWKKDLEKMVKEGQGFNENHIKPRKNLKQHLSLWTSERTVQSVI